MTKFRLPTSAGIALIIILAFGLLAAFLTTELNHTGGQLGVPLDDAWIHYQFARNLSQGQGFSFNPGEPTPGSTAPLWTVLLALAGLLQLPLLPVSLFLSAFFFIATILVTYGLTTHLTNRPAIGLVAALGVTFAGRLLWAALAGMETTAFAALSILSVWLYARRGLTPLAALSFGLASQVRPEGHALFALALLDAGWRNYKMQSGQPKWVSSWLHTLVIPVAIYGLIALPYLIFSLAQTGKPLPNTFYAKVGTEHLFSWRTLRETLTLHWKDNPLALLLIFPGLLPAWRRSRLVVAWLLLLPLLSAFTIDFVWHHGRYTLPLIPFVMIVAAQGLETIVELLPAKYRMASLVALVLLVIGAGLWQLPRWATMLGNNSREILEIDVALGHWLAENTPQDALIAVDDIGAIGYLSGRRIVDLNGLISPEMWPILRNEPQGLPRSEALTRALSAIQPDYLAIFPVWHWEMATNPLVAEPVRAFETATRTIIGEQEAVVYRARWPYLKAADPAEPVLAQLGEAIQLMGYDFSGPTTEQPQVELTLYWLSQAPISENYDVFVHLQDAAGAIIAQADNKPVLNLAPTHRWLPGDIIQDGYSLAWPEDLPAGAYTVRVGLYQRATGQRLPVIAGDAQDDAILLTIFSWPSGPEVN